MKPQILEKKLFVGLGSDIDSQRFFQYSKNQQFQELQKPRGLVYLEASNLLEARNLTQKFIKEYDINGSNWVGGRVIDHNDNFIAQISYNGRVWDSETYPCNEIEL